MTTTWLKKLKPWLCGSLLMPTSLCFGLAPALTTPEPGYEPNRFGFAIDLEGKNITFRPGVGFSNQDVGPVFFCSNNQRTFHRTTMTNSTGNASGPYTATVPSNCSGTYYYYIRFNKREAINNDPGSRFESTALFVENGQRVDAKNYGSVGSTAANWIRIRHPHAHDGTHEAVIDSTTNNLSVSQLARYTMSASDSAGDLTISFSFDDASQVRRLDMLEVGIRGTSPSFQFSHQCEEVSPLNTCEMKNLFDYGQIVSFEMTKQGGRSLDAQLYSHMIYYTVGQGFVNKYADPRLSPAGKGSTQMVFVEGNSAAATEQNAVFTQHLTDLTSRNDVDTFLLGHHLFHGIDPDRLGSLYGDVNIGLDSCGNCHFRDGRGHKVIQTAKGPRLPQPLYGLGLLASVGQKFTWDGSATSIREQTMNALRADHDVDPSSLPAGDLDKIVKYVEVLSVPMRSRASYDNSNVQQGDRLFREIGCGSCHTPSQNAAGRFIHAYTDMKVHTMADGDFRTPPLWGIGQNIRLLQRNGLPTLFMHDGSQTSLSGAITAHGKDAGNAKRAYNNLSSNQQRQIIDFLMSL